MRWYDLVVFNGIFSFLQVSLDSEESPTFPSVLQMHLVM